MRVRQTIWWVLRLLNLFLLFSIAGSAGLLLGTYSGIAELIPKARDLGNIRPGTASRVLSADGEVLATVATEHRQFVQLESVPEAIPQAFISVEDHDFYKHVGVDPRGMLRGLLYGRGTSTITQQLARNVYLTQERKLSRKLAEVVLAVQLERAYTKPEIMELYLNQIYFGEGAYGVQVAAKTYFGKDVGDLTLGECALLAGLPKRPEYYSPFEDEERARARRDFVLATMGEQGHLKAQEVKAAQKEPLELVAEKKPLGLSHYEAPYFTNYVLREVARSYGPEALYKGGLTIHTTLNLEMQRAAEEAVAWGMEQVKSRGFKVDQMALVAVEARTGAIKAMMGGVDYSQSQYNRVVQGGRQAGSAFKPFVYTTAMEQGYTPDSLVEDAAVSYPGALGKQWTPRNYDGKFHGQVALREALAKSYNVSAVKVADAVGVGPVIETARRMGLSGDMEEYLPLAIGYCDVSPLEMASAYAVFATGGMRAEPYGIRKIEDAEGRTLEEHKVVTWRVLHEEVAGRMVEMLAEVVRSGTGAGIRWIVRFPVAGKTGTSNEYRDAWFIGFTEDLSAAVWVGNDAFETTRNRWGKGVSGATLPAPIWARFMQKAQPVMQAARGEEESEQIIEIRPSEQSEQEVEEASVPPEELEGEQQDAGEAGEDIGGEIVTRRICPSSGLLAGPKCPNPIEVTYDLESGGRPPERECDVHGSPAERPPPRARVQEREEPASQREATARRVTLPICAISGKLATARCPVVVNRTFDADEAPTESCDRHVR